jgi:hypothetical protein
MPPCMWRLLLQRRELIGSVDFSQKQQKYAREQDVLEGSQDVTASLRRTRQLMMQNLEQTHGNVSVLSECQEVATIILFQQVGALDAYDGPGHDLVLAWPPVVWTSPCAPRRASALAASCGRHHPGTNARVLCSLLFCAVLCCCRCQQQAAAGCR